MLKYDEQDFSIRFYMRNTILNQIQLGILFLEEIWSCFFVKIFHCFSVLFLLIFPLSARNLIFFMLMSTESVLIYRFYKIYSPLEYTGHSLRKEELKIFHLQKMQTTVLQLLSTLSVMFFPVFFDVTTLFLFRYELNKHSKI